PLRPSSPLLLHPLSLAPQPPSFLCGPLRLQIALRPIEARTLRLLRLFAFALVREVQIGRRNGGCMRRMCGKEHAGARSRFARKGGKRIVAFAKKVTFESPVCARLMARSITVYMLLPFHMRS